MEQEVAVVREPADLGGRGSFVCIFLRLNLSGYADRRVTMYRYGNSNSTNSWMPEDLPRLPTYEMALAHHNSVRPYSKGVDAGKRPLGKKRRYSRSIIRICSVSNAIVFSYYKNDVVRLYADGRKGFSVCGYPSISTLHVLNETSATTNLRFSREKGKIYAVYKGTFYRMPSIGYVEIPPDGEIRGYEHETQHVIRFEVRKALKEKYEPFITFVRDMLTISPYVEVEAAYAQSQAISMLLNNKFAIDQSFTDRLADLRYMPAKKSNIHERTSKTSMWQFFSLLDDALLEKQESMLERFYFIAQKFVNSVMLDREQGVLSDNKMYFEEASKHFNELLKYRFAKEMFEEKHIAPRDFAVHDSNKHYFALCS
jgi:hypothetical protein